MSSRAKSRGEESAKAFTLSRPVEIEPCMKVYYVYMLLCADHSFYVGITNNLELRVEQHKYGLDPNCYTFGRRPVELAHSAEFHYVHDAIAWEKRLKNWSRAKKAALAKDDWNQIHRLAQCRNDTVAVRGCVPRPSTPLGMTKLDARDDKDVPRPSTPLGMTKLDARDDKT